MELFLDSVNLEEIEEAIKLGTLTGLTTTPTFMFRHGIKDIDGAIVKLSGMVPSLHIEALGNIMNWNTRLQRQLHRDLICNKFREIIDIARSFGACGCKVNGAGGDGGSITILGDGDLVQQRKMIKTLEKKGFRSIPISLADHGLFVWEEKRA